MTKVYSNPARESDPNALPDAETFYHDNPYIHPDLEVETQNEADYAGWYYWYCQSGYAPDSDPIGPFLTEQAAIDALREEVEDAADL